jgi:VanZ family protein
MEQKNNNKDKNSKQRIVISLFGIIVMVWIGLIFYFSSQPPGESNRQSKGAVNIFYQLDEHLDFTDTVIYDKAVYFFREVVLQGQYSSSNALIRKSAHVGIYLILGFMICLMSYLYYRKHLLSFILGVTIPTVVAVLDEYHQSFIGRTSSIDDVILDGFGAAVGTVICLTMIMMVKLGIYVKKK